MVQYNNSTEINYKNYTFKIKKSFIIAFVID